MPSVFDDFESNVHIVQNLISYFNQRGIILNIIQTQNGYELEYEINNKQYKYIGPLTEIVSYLRGMASVFTAWNQ